MANTREEVQAFAAVLSIAADTELLRRAAERQAEALEKIADGLTGVVNVIDTLDTNLGNHLAAVTSAVDEA